MWYVKEFRHAADLRAFLNEEENGVTPETIYAVGHDDANNMWYVVYYLVGE